MQEIMKGQLVSGKWGCKEEVDEARHLDNRDVI